tara:strand:- start:7570 stop:8040 length:471 start_codon:yes stop_codon:yes gene_type:complete
MPGHADKKMDAPKDPAMADDPNMQAMKQEGEKVDDLISQLDSALADVNEGQPGADAMAGAEKSPGIQQDLSPLEETLGVTAERAEMLFMAAQQLDSTKNKSPEDLAKMIADDFDILMQLEVIAARGMQGQPQAMGDQAMMPDAAAMDPGMMPQGGM